MSVQSYRQARQKIPLDEMAKHRGKWAAFSHDGARVVASAKSLERLEKKLLAGNEDPRQVVYEFVDEDETMAGGAELL
jgi:hypothetical protein